MVKTHSKDVAIVIFVPKSHADIMRDALSRAGAGKIGNYSHCSFSTQGIGRFIPQEEATPFIGKEEKPEEVAEERIETFCPQNILKKVIEEVKKVHPYEEPVIHVYPLI